MPCGVTTIRERLRQDDFRAQYDALKSELLQEASAELTARLGDAAGTLTAIMNDKKNAASVRVQAAGELLRQGLKYYSIAEIERRIAELERKNTIMEAKHE